MKKWNLDKLYKGFEDENFSKDMNSLDKRIEEFNKQEVLFKNYENKKETLINFLKNSIELDNVVERLYDFAGLVSSVESTNQKAIKAVNTLQTKLTELTKIDTVFHKWLVKYPNLEEDINSDEFLKEHEFHIHEIKRQASRLLDDNVEILIAKLQQTGSSSWGRLQSLLTSTLPVKFNDKTVTLSEIRNMAMDKDQKS